MNRKILGVVIILLFGFVLTGCGSSSPEDVATEFAKALSDADIEKAKELSSDDTNRKLDRLVIKCNQKVVKDYYNEAIKVYHKLEEKNDHALMKKVQEKIQKSVIEKYGSLEKAKEAGKGKSKKEMMQMIRPYMQDFLETYIKESDIKTKDPKLVAKLLTDALPNGLGSKRRSYTLFGMDSRDKALLKAAEDYVQKHPEPISSECVAKYTKFGLIDEVNFIETKKDAADRVRVRLEIIHKDGKSQKVSVKVESIKKEWKVSDLELNFW